jgi:hypothetical protein
MSDEKAAASDEPRATSQEAAGTQPPVPIEAAPPSAGEAPYSRFEVRHFADTDGRQFTHLLNYDGQPDRFVAAGVFEKAYPDHTGGRQAYRFIIPATCVDEAFARFDAAKAKAVKDAEAELDHQHMVAALTNQLPGPPPGQMAPVPLQGRGKPKRTIH